MAVWEAMSNRFIPTPNEGKWRSIAQGFNKHANFPNCVGAVDGKLIHIEKLERSESLYFNYKHYCSIVLLAVADSNFGFVYADAGSYGKDSDASIFRKLFFVAKTSAQVVTDARQTNRRVNSSSALCETLQRTVRLLTSVVA
jgi:hypothetical protein